MLAPAGIINIKKIIKGAGIILSKFKFDVPENKKIVKFYEETEETIITQAPPKELKRPDLARRESFMIKDKLVFRKTSLNIAPKVGSILKGIAIIFMPRFWVGIYQGLGAWLNNLGKKDRILVGALAACFLILIVSIIFTASGKKVKLATELFNQTVTNIDTKQADVYRYNAVGNITDATGVLSGLITSLQNSVPQTKEQESQKTALMAQLTKQSDEIQKITEINNFQEVINTTTWTPQAKADNLVFLNGNLYISDGLNKSIYNFNLKDSARTQITLADSSTLSSPTISDTNIYYLADSRVIKVNGQTASTLSVGPEKLQGESFIQAYAGFLYVLNKKDNQIYKYRSGTTGFTGRSNWFQEPSNLTLATDFKIDGKVTISQSDGDLLKYNKGKKVDYKTAMISPTIRADKVILTANSVYLLDLNNNRLISLTKDGALIKQYRLVKDSLKDFAIDEAGKSAYILAGTIVYKFGL